SSRATGWRNSQTGETLVERARSRSGILARMDEPFYMTVCEVARLLRVSPESVRRWCSRGQIACVRRRLAPGGPARYLVPRAAALAKLEGVAPEPDLRPAALVPRDPRVEADLRRWKML